MYEIFLSVRTIKIVDKEKLFPLDMLVNGFSLTTKLVKVPGERKNSKDKLGFSLTTY